ncbi:MAG: cytochrome C biosynthesis protein [Bacteroidales bacterium]|nr:cytochrome C biosynthesis protein [Bacteroidales bacterium]
MAKPKYKTICLAIFATALFIAGCGETDTSDIQQVNREPVIEPDYSGVTIPYNIAPMNFRIAEEGKNFLLKITSSGGISKNIRSSDGNVIFAPGFWRNLTENNKGGAIEIEVIFENKEKQLLRYQPVRMKVSGDAIDPWLCYRLLYPGYESWVEMQLILRSIESHKEKCFVENQLLEGNCINCHSFNVNKADRYLVHVRGSKGGTYLFDGKELTRRTLRTEEMKANTVYPSWHPSGRFVAFSTNRTVQSFHMKAGKNIEVTDLYSSLVIYDHEKNGISGIDDSDTTEYMETYPFWSPDGRHLYYCRAVQVKEGFDYSRVKYDLVRKQFYIGTGEFGPAEVIFNASEKDRSVSFPAVSPDGKYLLFTLHDYGTFSIWHREADLYLIDLNTMNSQWLPLNSNETESYHSWSSNGRWIVFSSKRLDGLTARPFIAYFGSSDSVGKPFVLPQKDPSLYKRMEKTINRPEFVQALPESGPRDFMRASKKPPQKAIWTGK